jgi:CRISPR/Cas system CSM-associated protein Csm3 (group 7 of RAMP superfamily)
MPDARGQVRERIFARGVWTAETAIHLGGESDGTTDMMLLRDASGAFFIPGASIAGTGRHYLAKAVQRRADYQRGEEPPELSALFGRLAVRDVPAWSSVLSVRDAMATNAARVFVRDGVHIDEKRGAAADAKKFDLEVLPAGISFAMEMSLVLYQEMPGNVDREKLVGFFEALLHAFHSGEIRLGARTRRGLGAGQVKEWEIRRLDMSQPAHLGAWLRQDPWRLAAAAIASPQKPAVRSNMERSLQIDAELALTTSLLVRSAGEKAGGPDSVHISENQRALLPGTGVAGALRARCLTIANTFLNGAAEPLIDRLFGPMGDSGKQLHAGRVIVSEAEVADPLWLVQGRVAIDRFTGGSRDTALFDEAPVWPKQNSATRVRLRIEVEEPEDAEAGLVLLAFRDLWLGDLTMGGETGVGRGVFRGLEARITERGRQILSMEAAGSKPENVALAGSDPARVEELVKAFREAAQ